MKATYANEINYQHTPVDEDIEKLTLGETYDVGYIEVNNSYSMVYLVGINGSFSSSMFDFDEEIDYMKLFEEQRI